MVELKFSAVKTNGTTVTGTINSETVKSGKNKISSMVEKYNLQKLVIAKKRNFIYKVKKNGKIVKGEQSAFSREEVVNAVTKLGYEVVSVNPKLFDFQIKPPKQEVLSFVKISAELLKQKLGYGEIMNLLVNDIKQKTLKETIRQINNELKKGTDSQVVYSRYESVLGKFTSYMLGLAAKSGNMTQIYEATAKFLERQMQFKKDLRSALITPIVTLFVLFLAVLFYVGYIFPETAKLFTKFNIELPPMTKATLDFSEFLIEYPIVITLILIIPPIILWRFSKTKKGKLLIDKWLLRIPIIGSLIHKTTIEVFCRVFYTLYTGAAESIEPIKIAAEAADNAYFEHQIKTVAIPLMLKKGVGLTDAFEATGVFTETALSRFHSAEETGTLKSTALQLANYYESETVFRLKNIVELVQVTIAMIIMIVMIGLTLISAETATISPKNPLMGR